ncbi:hypothetical protein BD779DRAFT_880173 [Infundibulicybe gibba]|nr:hypothetical protein BD779DRAFT_880173 [Infundibulicybe gibba]
MEEIHGQVVFPPSENQGGRASPSPCNRLRPVMPTTRFRRWDIVEPSQPTHTIRPNQVNFPAPSITPRLDGVHTLRRTSVFLPKQKRIITDSWLWNTTISEQVTGFIKEIEEFIGSQN